MIPESYYFLLLLWPFFHVETGVNHWKILDMTYMLWSFSMVFPLLLLNILLHFFPLKMPFVFVCLFDFAFTALGFLLPPFSTLPSISSFTYALYFIKNSYPMLLNILRIFSPSLKEIQALPWNFFLLYCPWSEGFLIYSKTRRGNCIPWAPQCYFEKNCSCVFMQNCILSKLILPNFSSVSSFLSWNDPHLVILPQLLKTLAPRPH